MQLFLAPRAFFPRQLRVRSPGAVVRGTEEEAAAGRPLGRAERPRRDTFLLVVHEPSARFYSRGATTLRGLGIPVRDAGAVCLRKKILAKVAARKGFATVPHFSLSLSLSLSLFLSLVV